MRRTRHLRLHATGCQVNLDARRITGIADGAVVDAWPAGLGTSITASASGASRPLYTLSAVNGRPGLDFDGSDDFMDLSAGGLALTNGASSVMITVVSVSDNAGDTAQNCVHLSIGSSAGSSRASLRTRDGGISRTDSSSRRLDADSSVSPGSVGSSGSNLSPNISSLRCDWVNDSAIHSQNGVDSSPVAFSSGAGTVSATDSVAARVGAATAAANRTDGRISHVLCASPMPGVYVRKRIRTCLSRTYRIPTV